MREERHAAGVVTWAFDTVPSGVRAAVTTRSGGTSVGAYASANLGGHVGDEPDRVRANRSAVAAALGVDRLVIADQQHGRRVAVVSSATGDPDLAATDALVTTEPGLAVAVLVADCAPVLLVDPSRRALAVVHAGRRGAVLDILSATVDVLGQAAGSSPEQLWAGIGPCIGPQAYEIAGDALTEVDTAFGGRHLRSTGGGRATFDLEAAVVERLVACGVALGRIERSATSTDARPDALFSDRAARPCGRFGLVAVLEGAAHPAR